MHIKYALVPFFLQDHIIGGSYGLVGPSSLCRLRRLVHLAVRSLWLVYEIFADIERAFCSAGKTRLFSLIITRRLGNEVLVNKRTAPGH